MPGLGSFGRLLVISGAVLVLVGLVFMLSGKIAWIGRLPGDIYIKKKDITFYFPLGTSILLSIILSLILWFINRK
jgi:hypothetical protein